ncbi:FCD domain-containing protein [Conexibacter sp. CPCC 206217]|uniref:FCD domain-containing protein n=1 Tax=Conexibacter sp. CPCC 206217 TaxID=3064574 RepID=UPI0027226771|nr:FCD domain-containing protein [Conexibacter sp. CPCC 206217]MDO8210161.1 FCD domain-containing protein [Conexibacter sp. CPCC 206217]
MTTADNSPRATAQELERAILRMLRDTDVAIGAGSICAGLRDAGHEISEATVGRLLRELDRRGLTSRDSNRGRVLSAAGVARLRELDDSHARTASGARVAQALDPRTLREVIDFVYVRRGLEREAARLAAIRATEDDIAHLLALVAAQEAADHDDWEHGWAFHEAVAAASHNEAVISLFAMFSDTQEAVGRLSHDADPAHEDRRCRHHEQIVAAIAAHDPDAAEEHMMEHLTEVVVGFEQALHGAAAELEPPLTRDAP